MMTGWTKWRISVAVERRRPLSPGLARRVERDPECRRFYEASLAMADRLRNDADQIVDEEMRQRGAARLSEPLALAPARRARRLHRRPRVVFAVGAAVALAVGVVLWFWPVGRPADSPVAMQESDVVELVQLVRQLKQNVDRATEEQEPRLRQILDRSEDALRTPMVREAENVAVDTRHILQAFSLFADARNETEPFDSDKGK